MRRGTAVGSTVNELYDTLKMLISYGLGESVVQVWEPDIDDWAEIGYITYGGDSFVRLYHE